MFSPNHTFFKRAGLVIGGLLLFVIIFVITTLFPPNCTLSAPYNNTNPIVFKCAGSVTISTPDNPDFFINTINPSLHIFTPLFSWDKTPVLHLIVSNEFLPIKQNLTIPVPTIIPVTFFAESKENGSTTVSMVSDNAGVFSITQVFTADDISDVAFDGAYAISYLQKDLITKKPQVKVLDLLTQTDTTFLKPLLGKDFGAFAPSGDHSSYTWQENDLNGKSQIMIISMSNQLAVNVNEISNLGSSISLTTPVYSGDGNQLLSLEPATNRVIIYDLYGYVIKPKSLQFSGKIIALGFTGEKKDIPFIASDSGVWFYQGSKWQFNSETPQMINVMCPSGAVYMSPIGVSANSCATLKIVDNTIVSEYNSTTTKIYDSKNKLSWVNESTVISP